MKKLFCILAALISVLIFACSKEQTVVTLDETQETASYVQITQEEAKRIMDSGAEHIILDVREQDEYDQGHIPGAILIPYTEIEERASTDLPDRDELILVYCRSGRRSKIASESLAELGYTNVKEFGGIIHWQYEIEREKN